MRRRDISKVLFASAASSTLLTQRAQAQTCNPPCFPLTQAESTAGVTPTHYEYYQGFLQRYGGAGDGTINSTAALTRAAAQNSQASGVSVNISGGTYRISANTTIPKGVTLDFSEGGILTVDSPCTLTIHGNVIAAPGQQIFAGPGTVVFETGSVTEVYPDWWGSIPGAVNKAVAAVTGKYIPVRVINGTTYRFDQSLVIRNHGDAILGPAQNNDTNHGDFYGAILEYTGTGMGATAIRAGIAPGSSGDFIYRVTLEGFVLKVNEQTAIAMHLWHLGGRSRIRDITIRGNPGNSNVGVQMDGCIDTDIQRLIVFGQGDTSGSALLENGYRIQNGFNNSPTTTLRFVECYVTQCRFGFNITTDSTVDMISCVYESCQNAGLIAVNAKVNLFSPWFENNGSSGNGAIRLQGADCVVTLSGGRIDIGPNQDFIQCEANNVLNLLGGTSFASSHATPRIVLTGGTQPVVAMLGQNVYPANFANSDTPISKLIRYHNGTLDVPTLRVATRTPASASAAGAAGTMAWDAGFIYVCTATNTWKRVALSTW